MCIYLIRFVESVVFVKLPDIFFLINFINAKFILRMISLARMITYTSIAHIFII